MNCTHHLLGSWADSLCQQDWCFSDTHHKINIHPTTVNHLGLQSWLLSQGSWGKEEAARANSSSLLNLLLGGGPGQAGEHKERENQSQILIGPPSWKDVCQATHCQGPVSPSWVVTHKAGIVPRRTWHPKKKLCSAITATAKLPSSLSYLLSRCVCFSQGLGDLTLPDLGKEKACVTYSLLWWRRDSCPSPHIGGNCYR